MMLQDLHPNVRRLPQTTATMVVAHGIDRLLKDDVQHFTRAATSRSLHEIKTSEMEVEAMLGEGSFSVVYALDDRFAVKVLKPDLLETPHLFEISAIDLVREGMILRALQHPHIVKCHSMGEIQAFANGRHDSCVLVLDRLHRTLRDQLEEWRSDSRQSRPLSTDDKSAGLVTTFFRCKLNGVMPRRRQQANLERTNMLCQLADAIQYLHAKRIMHRDLKPNNLGLTEEGRLKIFDFGFCRILPEEALKYPDKTYRFTNNIGSRRYMAPEVARGDEYNAKSDVYSFALICYAVLSLETPHENLPDKVVLDRVVYDGLRPSLPKSWPRPVKSLLQRCWNERLSSRPTMSKVSSQLRSTLDYMLSPSDSSGVSLPDVLGPSLHDASMRTKRTNSIDSDEHSVSTFSE